jgi:hypothetical protein
MRRFAFAGKVLAALRASALGSMFKKAYGQTTSTIAEVLQFALTLEHLKLNFIPRPCSKALLIYTEGWRLYHHRDHEVAHVALLQQTLTA